MQFTDSFDCPIEAENATAVAEFDRLARAFLAHGASVPTHLQQALNADVHFPLALLAKGFFSVLLGRAELLPAAQAAYDQALAQSPLPERESGYLAALGCLLRGETTPGIQHLEGVLRRFPRDAFALKLSHGVRFTIGDSAGMRRSIERVLASYTPSHPAYGFVMGCYAFALEETGAYQKAESCGLQAVEHTPDDAWGLHAVAHVYDMTAQSQRAITLIESQPEAFSGCGNFRYHVWWHLALCYLEQRDFDRVLCLYDEEIRADKTDDYRDISNATALLSRLELEGVSVGNRWQELAELSANRCQDGRLAFADLHYLLALSRERRDEASQAMLARIKQDAQLATTEQAQVMALPGVAAAEGLIEFGLGNYMRAAKQLCAARPEMQRLGGSHAQRDVFERITIEAVIRAQDWEAAKALLQSRVQHRGGVPDAYTAWRRQAIEQAEAAAHPQAMGARR